MRHIRYATAGRTGVGAVRADGSVTTSWAEFEALRAEPELRRRWRPRDG